MLDLAGEVALQHADDLALGATFFYSALHVGLGVGIGGQSGDDDGPERPVGLAITTSVQPVPVTLPEEASRVRRHTNGPRPLQIAGVQDCRRR